MSDRSGIWWQSITDPEEYSTEMPLTPGARQASFEWAFEQLEPSNRIDDSIVRRILRDSRTTFLEFLDAANNPKLWVENIPGSWSPAEQMEGYTRIRTLHDLDFGPFPPGIVPFTVYIIRVMDRQGEELYRMPVPNIFRGRVMGPGDTLHIPAGFEMRINL
jgi:hypothetical protein